MPEAIDHTPRIVNHALVPAVGSYEVDPTHTFVTFSAQHLVIGRVGGRFGAVSGTITIADDPSASTIEAKVESASVNTLVAMRDDDLRSERYLNVTAHPAMTYRSTSISQVPGGVWHVTGDLTLLGITRPLELAAHFGGATIDPWGNVRIAVHAAGSITRRDFGLTYELLREAGGLPVRNDISIEIDVEAVLRS